MIIHIENPGIVLLIIYIYIYVYVYIYIYISCAVILMLEKGFALPYFAP